MSELDEIPTFSDQQGGRNEQALKCPNCGDEFLHQTGISVFNRHKEDDAHGLAVEMDYNDGDVSVSEQTTTEAGNPSSRRDGIRIRFSCEQCSTLEPAYELVIQQHKGNEFVHWEELSND